MSLWIRDTSTVPPERWNYPGVDGKPICVPSYNLLYPAVVEHYAANQKPVPTQQDVIDWLCANLHVMCVDGNQPLINKLGKPFVFSSSSCCAGITAAPTQEESI